MAYVGYVLVQVYIYQFINSDRFEKLAQNIDS
jgi:hypothetical protein